MDRIFVNTCLQCFNIATPCEFDRYMYMLCPAIKKNQKDFQHICRLNPYKPGSYFFRPPFQVHFMVNDFNRRAIFILCTDRHHRNKWYHNHKWVGMCLQTLHTPKCPGLVIYNHIANKLRGTLTKNN